MAENGETHRQGSQSSTLMSSNEGHDQDEEDIEDYNIFLSNNSTTGTTPTSSMSEIEEVVTDESSGRRTQLNPIQEAAEIESSVFSYDIHKEEKAVYVLVGKTESTSMDALSWTLNNLMNLCNLVYLIHVFPELKFVPNPLGGGGRMPKSQVRPEQVEIYEAQERGKRRELLQKFIDKCSARKVSVETILIESADAAKAVVELLFVLRVRKLVIGVSKSSLRKLSARKGNGTADRILQSAPGWCEIKCICEGKDHSIDVEEMATSVSSNSSDSNRPPNSPIEDQRTRENGFAYCCFKPNAVNE